MRFSAIRKFTRPIHEVDIPWDHVEVWILRTHPPVDMDPVYQRGHVWTPDQQSRYIEFCLMGGMSSRNIYWNCSSWDGTWDTPVEIVDGKQRVTAVIGFMNDRVTAFGLTLSQFEGKLPLMSPSTCLRIHIGTLDRMEDVIQWYLDLNFAGTPHTDEELERVKALLSSP